MLCLNCSTDGIAIDQKVCPNAACGAYLPSLLRDVLPAGTALRGDAYRIDYALGRGGFGITYRAVHTGLEQVVAIKEFYPQDLAHRDGDTMAVTISTAHKPAFDRSLRRFLREGQILSRLDHPNVVKVRDLFEERGTAYLVMELVPGQTLRRRLDSLPERRLPSAEVDVVMEQLVAALAVVHAESIYHLDLKPDNVLLTETGQAMLIDFGAAKQGLSSGMTTQSYTEGYAPPEVIAGGEVGPESDIFELGMLLHELATGERPPSALARLMKDEWTPEGLTEPWRTRVRRATRLERGARPAGVAAWWSETPAAAPAQPPKSNPALTAFGVGVAVVGFVATQLDSASLGDRLTFAIVCTVVWGIAILAWKGLASTARGSRS